MPGEFHRDWSEADFDLLETASIPGTFRWGVATAAHQIEGGNVNNWSAFEEAQGIERSGDACDHWNRMESDIDLIEATGSNSYRFSIEWSRLEPQQGDWNEDALERYSTFIDALLERGIEPMVTLHHFTHTDLVGGTRWLRGRVQHRGLAGVL